MKKVLCFGDSNTFGFIPESGGRYDKSTRWTGILSNLGAGNFKIIEAGCNNRTAFSDNPAGVQQTGYKILPTLLTEDLAYVILAIGINDLQIFYKPTIQEVKNGMQHLIDIVHQNCPNTKIILVSPPRLDENIFNGYFSTMFDKDGIEKSRFLSGIYETLAAENNCRFVDLDKIVKVSALDGLHFSPQTHKTIANTMLEVLTLL